MLSLKHTYTGSIFSIFFTGRICNHKTFNLKHIKVNALLTCFSPLLPLTVSLLSIIT